MEPSQQRRQRKYDEEDKGTCFPLPANALLVLEFDRASAEPGDPDYCGDFREKLARWRADCESDQRSDEADRGHPHPPAHSDQPSTPTGIEWVDARAD